MMKTISYKLSVIGSLHYCCL